MTNHKESLLTAIYTQMTNEGFPIPESERPNIWSITEKGGSFEGRLARFLTYWLNPHRNLVLEDQPLKGIFKIAAKRRPGWNIPTARIFQRIQDEDVSGSNRIDASVWFDSSAVFIEAKMGSKEGPNQRARYLQEYTNRALDLGILKTNLGFLYLTRFEQTGSAQEPWVNINYGDLLPIIEDSLVILDRSQNLSDLRARKVLKGYLEDFYVMLASQLKRQENSIKERFLDSSPSVLATVAMGMSVIDKEVTNAEIVQVLDKFKIKPLWADATETETNRIAEKMWQGVLSDFKIPSETRWFKSSTQLESIIRSIWQFAYESPGMKVNPNLELAYMSGEKAHKQEAVGMKWVAEHMNQTDFEQNSQVRFNFGFQADDTQWTAVVIGHPDLKVRRKVHLKFQKSDLKITFEPFGQSEGTYGYDQNRRIFDAAPIDFEYFNVQEPKEAGRTTLKIPYQDLEQRGERLFTLLQKVCLL